MEKRGLEGTRGRNGEKAYKTGQRKGETWSQHDGLDLPIIYYYGRPM